jgi:hypothetical protein
MSTMIVELYDALKSAGAPEEKAMAAARALALPDDRFDRIDGRFDSAEKSTTNLQIELATVKAELGMVKWIVSGIGFGVVLLVLRSFWPGA